MTSDLKIKAGQAAPVGPGRKIAPGFSGEKLESLLFHQVNRVIALRNLALDLAGIDPGSAMDARQRLCLVQLGEWVLNDLVETKSGLARIHSLVETLEDPCRDRLLWAVNGARRHLDDIRVRLEDWLKALG